MRQRRGARQSHRVTRSNLALEVTEDVRVTLVRDNHARDAEELSARVAEVSVGAVVLDHRRLREHGVVLGLGLLQRLAVVRDQNKLGCT